MKYLIKLLILFIFSINSINADCSDLSYDECINWGGYCEWNEETNMCQQLGGGGDDTEFGPYETSVINESDGLRNGPDYEDGILYYPIDANFLLGSIIFTPGFGGGSSTMLHWGEFFASYGFISMVIGPNDAINDTHEQRAFGLLDAIQTIKAENLRIESPINNYIDTTRFIVAGYSMGGGASQIALTIESIHNNHIVGAIALNPTILIEDCDVCTDNEYCICLVPEFLEHEIPTLVIAGQNELNELPDYAGLLGQDIYLNTPEANLKILYEIQDGGHYSAGSPTGYIGIKTLEWVQYLLIGNENFCDSLLVSPENASQFITTLDCNVLNVYDLNYDGIVNGEDLDYLVISIINNNAISVLGDLDYNDYIDIFDLLTLSDYLQ